MLLRGTRRMDVPTSCVIRTEDTLVFLDECVSCRSCLFIIVDIHKPTYEQRYP